MARVRNTMKLIEESIGHMNVRYDMRAKNIMDIKESSHDIYDSICNGFRFGYMQGMKAAKAEMQKGRCSGMNDLTGTVITSLEVAQMVGKDHSKLLRDIRKYSEQLAEAKIGLGDFFSESTYLDSNNQSRPCYLVTKKGCEFIAHKLTGQKGTEFTARYINRFHEMEWQQINPNGAEIPIGEVASYLKVMDRVAVRQNTAPYKIAEAFRMVSEQFGIQLPADFVKIPEYEQMALDL